MSKTNLTDCDPNLSCAEMSQQYGCNSDCCQKCCVDLHQVDYCTFWSMVHAFQYSPTASPYDCSADQDPTQGIPVGLQITSDKIQELLGIPPNTLDCNYYSVFTFYPKPVDPTTNQDIKVHPFLTAESSDKPAVFEYSYIFNESIPLFQGLINKYPTGTFYFFKAMYTDPKTQISTPNVTFYVSDGNQENYYCDVTVLFP